jgi:hypothetical protein
MEKFLGWSACLRLIQNIQGALNTQESGDALIEVARNAHRAEQELAALKVKENDRNS